jgi:hypothetical protein
VARYKVLQSVAHSVGHSFVSLTNWGDDDYVMGNLLRRARATGVNTFWVDLLAGTLGPEDLAVPAVRAAATRYVEWFPELVEQHLTEMRWIRSARLEVRFDLARRRPARWAPGQLESPFVCRVAIEDDRGKVWAAEQSDWWFPEPLRPTRGRSQLLRRFLATLRHAVSHILRRVASVAPRIAL